MRNVCTTYLMVDAQSVKNADSARQKGYDAGKKVSGIKRHIAVDTQGLPHAVAVTTAEVTDRKGMLQAFECCKPGLSQVKSVLADSGYAGEPFAQGVREALHEEVTVQNRQTQRAAHLQSYAPALGGRAQLCLVGEASQAMEEL